jgi:hypothetical protein
MIKMRLLVTGGRDFHDEDKLRRWIFEAVGNDLESDQIQLIHGGARGADRLAGRIARQAGFRIRVFPARWSELGDAAGVIRNNQMLRETNPHVVLAAPGGRETDDMVNRVRKAIKSGLPIRLIDKRKEL